MSFHVLRVVALFAAASLPLGVAPMAATAAVVPTITAIAAGYSHTCALTSEGGVTCWGANASGQLGDGSTNDSSLPVEVTGLASGVTAISAGGLHTCALLRQGTARCWGDNQAGQLGDGTTTSSNVPVDVTGLAGGVTAIAAGYGHTCALTTEAVVMCWGGNNYGQLGTQKSTSTNAPATVPGLASGVTAIAAGDYHTCAITGGGGVKCWGWNLRGQLGDGNTYEWGVPDPVDVLGLADGIIEIAAGDVHTCALTSGGGVKCWGDNKNDQLGNVAPRGTSPTPVDVSGLASGISAIAAGGLDTCALSSSGGVKCWGVDDLGQLGNGTTAYSAVPVDVSGLARGITAIAVGGNHTCALTGGGGVECWGANGTGELGNGTWTNSGVPVDVNFDPSAEAVPPPPSPTPTAAPAFPVLAPVAATLPVKGDADVLGTEIHMAAGPAGTLYVSIPDSGGDVVTLLGEGGQPRPGWPIRLPGATGCGQLLPAAGGSLRVVCGVPSTVYGRGGAGGNRRAFAFDASGRLLNGWPVDLDDAEFSGRMIGDDLTLVVRHHDGGTSDADTEPVHLLVIRADGSVRNGAEVRTSRGEPWVVGPDGVAYRRTVDDPYRPGATTTLEALDLDGARAGWPVTFDGNTSEIAFDGRGRLHLVVGSPREKPARALIFDPGDRSLAPGSAELAIVPTSQWLDLGSEYPGPPIVADDGSAFILSTEGGSTTIVALDPDGKPLGGWPYRSRHGIQWGRVTGSDSTGYYQLRTSPTAGSDNRLYLSITAASPSTGGSMVAITSEGRIADGWPVRLRRAGSMFWSMAAASDGGVWALAIEPESQGASATMLAISHDGTVRGRITIVDPSFQAAAAGTAGAPTVTALAAGYGYTCALTSGGGIKCWGTNDYGQLGTVRASGSAPADVLGLESGVSAIAAGGAGTCALTSDGAVKRRGITGFFYANDAQIVTGSIVPVDVPGLEGGFTAISASGGHACALASGGGIKCWESNGVGQLGNGTVASDAVTVPVDVVGLTSRVTAIAAGGSHTCAVMSGGGVMCWGADDHGQLGDGSTKQSNVPVDVLGLASGVTAVAAGGLYACALTTGGGVKCWGSNDVGELGDGHGRYGTYSSEPVDVVGLASGVTAISAGDLYACAITTGGGVKCWGVNSNGQLGDGTTVDRPIPVDVQGLESGVTAIAAGGNHSCALMSGGRVKCWGANDHGQLGDGTTTESLVPVDVVFPGLVPPATDTAEPDSRRSTDDFPLIPLLAGVAAAIAVLVRRRARAAA